MKFKIDCSKGSFSLPLKVLSTLSQAEENDLKVLIYLASKQDGWTDSDEFYGEVCEKLDLAPDEVKQSVAFLRGAGVISSDKKGKKKKELTDVSTAETKSELKEDTGKKVRKLESPQYTAQQVESIMTGNKELANLINACQGTLGKMFTPLEINKILGLSEYLKLESEYILTLFAYCEKNGKKSVAYAEKTAYSLYDDGIDTVSALEKYIKDRESFKSVETKLRQVFGLGERSLSSREKENFERWTIEWQFGIDVIKKAYEITVDKISKPSVPYVNKILSNWQSKGYKTVDDVEGAIEAYREKKNESEASGFDTNEFFELAIKRAYKTMAD